MAVRFAAGLTVAVRFAAGLTVVVRFAAGLTVVVRLAAGLTVAVRFVAGLTEIAVRRVAVRGLAVAVRRVADEEVRGFAVAVRRVADEEVRAVLVDVRARVAAVRDVAAEVRFAVVVAAVRVRRGVVAAGFALVLAERLIPALDALLTVLFAAGLAAARVVVAVRVVVLAARLVLFAVLVVARLAAGLAVALAARLAGVALAARLAGVTFAARLAVAFVAGATVVSSMAAPTALRRTEATPVSAAALEPYAWDEATSWPLGACRVNRNLPALSLLRVNFAGTNASRSGRTRAAAAGGLRSSTGVLVGITLRPPSRRA